MTSSVVYFRDAPSPPPSLSSRPRCRGRRHHSPTSCRRSSSWNCCSYFRLPQHLRRAASLASGLPALSSWVQSGLSPMERVLDEVDDRFAFEALPFHDVPRWEWSCSQFIHEGWLPPHRQFSALASPFLWSDGNFRSFHFSFSSDAVIYVLEVWFIFNLLGSTRSSYFILIFENLDNLGIWFFFNLLVFYEELTPRHATSRHVTSRHSLSPHFTSPHVTSRHLTLPRTMSRYVMSLHVTSPHVTPCHVTPHHITSHHVMSRHVTSRHAASRHVTSCHATPRHVTSRRIASRHVMLRHATSRL